MKKIAIGNTGREAVLVDREQLRANGHIRRMKAATDANPPTPLPTPPGTWDHSKGGTLKYPTLGNDRYGDCYYVAIAKAVMTATGNVGTEWAPNEEELVRRYLAVAGGDNGMYDEQVVTEWTGGIIGPDGPYKLLDRLLIRPDDAAAHSLMGWLFGGTIWTASLADAWLRDIRPGMIWDAGRGVSPDPGNGHAMIQTGKDGKGRWITQTWGLNPPVLVTQAGLMACDPEVWVAFQREWFNEQGKTPNGHTWEECRAWWIALGGKDVGPFGPGPNPEPDPAGNVTGKLTFPGVKVDVPGFDISLTASLDPRRLLRSGLDWGNLIAVLEAILAVLKQMKTAKEMEAGKDVDGLDPRCPPFA